MATDSLQIFGTSYTGVTGIKATDSSNGTKTYIRPQGTKSITANGTGIDVTEYASVDVAVSGGGGTVTWETMYDANIRIVSSSPNYFIISDYTTPIQAGETYRVTWGTGGTQYISETIADNSGQSYDGYVFGNPGIVGGTDTGEPYLIYRDSASRMLGVTNVAGSQTIHIKIERQVISSSGSTLIPKTITENGVYYPANDNADGYSSVTVAVGSSEWVTVFDTVTKNIVSEGDTGYIDGLTPFPNSIEYGSIWRITYNGTPYICTAVDDYDMSEANMTAGYLIGNSVLFGGSSGNGEPFCAQRYPGYGTGGMLIVGTVATSGQVTIKVEKQISSSSSGGGDNALIIQFSKNATTGYWEPDKTFAEIQTAYNNGLDIALTSPADSYAVAGGFDGDVLDYNVYWYDYATDRTYFYYYTFDSNGVADDSGVELMRPPTETKQISITGNGTTIEDVTNYANASITVSVPSGQPSLQAKTNISPTTSSQTIQADSGYDGLSSVQINAMPTGTTTSPTSISGSSASVSTGTNTLTLTKTISVTPRVTTAGYVSSGTAGNSSVSLTASVTTKAAATITPSTSNQTIASGTYLTGTQTIAGDANLVGSNIISGKSIFGVAGTVAFQTYYTGSSTPASSLGSNGDIYLKT